MPLSSPLCPPRLTPLAAVLMLALPSPALAQQPTVNFQDQIRPLLADRCFACHGPDAADRQADLRLDTLEGSRADLGDARPITAGHPDQSAVYQRIISDDPDVKMPPPDSGKQLNAQEIELIRQWIQQGGEYAQHWSYQPIVRPKPPAIPNDQWSRSPIDRFILHRLQAEKLRPSKPADPVTLARRIHFDLTGLPPRPEVVDRFADNPTQKEFERLVDQLLESHHYGERMAMYWLDLVRYADTVGYHGDQDHAISPYRDYVIHAFNTNKPFDQFTIEQLAGDLLPEPTQQQRIATGYNRVLQTSHEGGVQKQEYLTKYSADRVRNVSSVWLGATMGCCECHDHKFDPLSQRDFYSMAAFFADVDDSRTFAGTNSLPTKREPELKVVTEYDQLVAKQLQAELEPLKTQHQQLTAELDQLTASADPNPRIAVIQQELKTLLPQIKSLETRITDRLTPRRTMVTESVKPRVIRVLERGDWMDTDGPIVAPAVPSSLPPLETEGRATRLDLAHWLMSRENPLTARVFVNRLWKLFYGRGISSRLDDLGAQGEPPVHPELLDWLAAEFIDSGWDVKHMVRLMVTSSAYQQSSFTPPQLAQRDPNNRLLARQSRFRIEAEMVRDQALFVSGLLIDELGGQSARPYQPAGYYKHLNFPRRKYTPDTGTQLYRRGLYTHWQRIFLHPMLKAFDAPSREECTAERPTSNTPLASLVLLNDPTFVEAAQALAERIQNEGGTTDTERIRWAWKLVLSRDPDAYELQVANQLLEAERPARADDSGDAGAVTDDWQALARLLLNLSETITRN